MPKKGLQKLPGKNNWKIVVEYGKDPQTGSRKRIVRRFRGTIAQADAERAKIVSALALGTYTAPSGQTVADYIRWWLPQHAATKNLKPKTVECYESVINTHVVPRIGSIKLTQLKSAHIQRMLTDIAADHPRTAELCLAVLRLALKHAVRPWEYIPYNPAAAVSAPTYDPRKKSTLTAVQLAGFLSFARQQNHRDYPIIFLAASTGMRRGELLALRWSDVDLDAGILRIRFAAQRLVGIGIHADNTKTQSADRDIDIAPDVVEFLRAHKDAQDAARDPDYIEDHNLVFPAENGKILDPPNFSRRFARLVRAARAADAAKDPAQRLNLPHFTPHDLRHTHASLLLGAGVPLHVVQERLGHKKASYTADIYGHAVPGHQRAAAGLFADVLAAGDKERQETDNGAQNPQNVDVPRA